MFLVIDDEIRFWVIVPIVLIAILVSIIRTYLFIAIQNKKKSTTVQLQKFFIVERINNILQNGFILSKQALEERRYQFNDPEYGYLSCFMNNTNSQPQQMPFQDPNMAIDMLKSSTLGMMPMIIIGGIINFMFSGFVATRVPFSLNNNFRSMLQSSIEGVDLDPSWVSSVSWYLLALFGTQDLIALFCDTSLTNDMNPFMPTNINNSTSSDINPQVFKSLWESLEVYEPEDTLDNIEAYIIQNGF